MFERFTRPARDAVTAAQTYAAELGHERIGDDHLLLAIDSSAGSSAAQALAEAGVDAAGLRAEIERRLPMPAVEVRALVPYDRGDLISAVHESGVLISAAHEENGTAVHAHVSERLAAELAPFTVG